MPSIFDPAGAPARGLAELSGVVLFLFGVVMVVMFGLILWPALRRRRGRCEEHAPIDEGGGQPWIFIGGFSVPFVLLALVFVYGLRTMHAYPLNDGPLTTPQIVVTGHQWWWEVHYVAGPPHERFATANEIHVPLGTPVDVMVTSADVIHSFWVPQLHGKTDLIPGRQNWLRLEADRPGVYRGQCAEYCGAQHAHMALLVVAEPPEAFAAWSERQRRPAREPTTELARRGRELFVSGPCALCHGVRGTPAAGGIAPDLTHVASRLGLAANMLTNKRANLAGWIVHAQSLKPGAQMPDLEQLSGRELQALVAYLEQLH